MKSCGTHRLNILQHHKWNWVAVILKDGKLSRQTIIYGDDIWVYLRSILIAVIQHSGDKGLHRIALHTPAHR